MHVEHQKLSPLIMRRAIKVYMDQFDPERMYLLQEEVKPFLSLKDQDLMDSAQGVLEEKLEEFAQLNSIIERAILRSRRIRAEMQMELHSENRQREIASYSDFAKDVDDLKSRHCARWAAYLATRAQYPSEKVFSLWEKRHKRFEKQYLSLDDKGRQWGEAEHNLCMHVLKAFAKSLDAHTAYFSPEEAHLLKARLEQQFSGIGVFLSEDVEGITIVGLVKNSPAEKSGRIRPGDTLAEIDGQSTLLLSYEEVLKKLQGNHGSRIQLGLKREGNENLVRVNLIREKIILEEGRLEVSSEPFADGIIGKLTLPSFYEGDGGLSCARDMKEALLRLKKEGKLYGVVIDLRENLGGFLHQAVNVTGLFMSCGVIVVAKYADGEMKYLRELDGRITYDGPIVLLISRTSASAAEIVAQALQDYGIGVVAGDEQSWGKGTIQYQTFTNTSAPSFYKVTVGRYFTVSGRSTQIDGVRSNIRIPTKYHAERIGERYLEFPLKPDRISSAYVDTFSDIDPKMKPWFQKNYAVQLQKRFSLWTQLLPILSANSEYRLAHSKSFQKFLTATSKKEKPELGDLQMQEAVQVLKDMAYLKMQKMHSSM